MAEATEQETKDKAAELINGYTTDMLALETHIRVAVAGQIEDLDDEGAVKDALVRIHANCDAHVHALEALTQRREQNLGGVSKVVKQAVSSVLGLGAAAVDFVRTDKMPKDLRDDYTALSLAYIGSLMLHTSALTLGDSEVAGIAKVNLGDHADAMMLLQRLIPEATVAVLLAEGLTVDSSQLAVVGETIEAAWRK